MNQVSKTLQWLREYAAHYEQGQDAHAAMAAFGIFGAAISPDYGGLGFSRGHLLQVFEQLGAIDIALAASAIVHYNATQAISRHGTEQQKRTLLTEIIAGQRKVSFSLTEPGAGSNLRGIKSYADPCERGYHLFGQKAYCGGAQAADTIVLLARVEQNGPITAFLVDRRAAGLTVHPPHPLVGVPGLSIHDITLRRVFVPRDAVLGLVGQGFEVVEGALSDARLAIAALSLGAMKRALQWILRFASRRTIGSGLMLGNPAILALLDDFLQAASAIESLIYSCATLLDQGEALPSFVMPANKVASTEWLGRLADQFVQWLGARGYCASSPAGKLFVDCRLLRIGEGPTEALLSHIGALYDTEPHIVENFLSRSLKAPEVLLTLQQLVARLPTDIPAPLRYQQTGTLVVDVMLWAAAQDAATRQWARRHTENTLQRLLAQSTHLSAQVARERIAQFQSSIGELSETVPQKQRLDDPYLSDDGVFDRGGDLCADDSAQIIRWESRGEGPVGHALVHQMIAQMAAKAPRALAVYGDEFVLTYEELLERARVVGAALQRHGVKPRTLVPILLRRSPWMVVCTLAVLNIGAVAVPLEPASPTDRLRRLLRPLSFPLLLTEQLLAERLPEYAALLVEHVAEGIPESIQSAPDTPALIIHTSGSTGQPKAVVLSHGALAYMFACRQQAYPLDESDRVLWCTSPAFDVSFWEYIGPLTAGACVVTPANAVHEWDGAEVATRIKSLGITAMQIVPALLHRLLQYATAEDLASLRLIYCGGEALSKELLVRTRKVTRAIFVNAYGPTEATIECSWYQCPPNDDARVIPIGRPIPGRKIYLLDDHRRRVPPGTPGELYIGGSGLSLGYHNDDEMNRRCFFPDPFSDVPNAAMYKTGDLGRYREDGEIEFLGRADRQVKIRGVRIELGEVEQIFLEHPNVTNVSVQAVERGDDGKVLVAYASVRDELTQDVLFSYIKEKLPRALWPSAIVLLDQLPMTNTGKVDLRALPDVNWSSFQGTTEIDANATEKVLLEIWSRLLSRGSIALDDDFFQLGGHSLTGAQMLAQVRERFGCRIRLHDFFSAPTVRALALAVDSARAPSEDGQCEELLLSLYDETRAREVPILIYLPKSSTPAPIVLFSHGLGGTREGYAYLGRTWAEHGYVAVHLQHAGSDMDVLLQAKNPMLSAMHVTTDREQMKHRPKDLAFVIHQLDKLQHTHGALAQKLDLTRIGAAGHSFGAFTALAAAGAELIVSPECRERFHEPRIKAVVALSAPAFLGGTLDARSYHYIETPCLHVSGTKDDGPVFQISPEERRFSYDHTSAPEQYFMLIDGAHHFSFGDNARWNGHPVMRDPMHHLYLQKMTTAFWDAYLKRDPEALQWLRQNAAAFLDKGATLEMK